MLLPAQIYAIIALLVAFGVPQNTVTNVQAILEKQPAPISTSVPVGTTVELLAGTSEPCVPNPVVTLTSDKQVISSGQMVVFSGSYSTGCPLDGTKEWVFKSNYWNKGGGTKDYDYGTVGNYSSPGFTSDGRFRTNGWYTQTETFTLTIDGVTATTTVTVQ